MVIGLKTANIPSALSETLSMSKTFSWIDYEHDADREREKERDREEIELT